MKAKYIRLFNMFGFKKVLHLCFVDVQQTKNKTGTNIAQNINKDMTIREELVERIRTEPSLFAEIFKRMNTGKTISTRPESLIRRLERKSEVVRTNVVIADYFREIGYAEDQIFELEEGTEKP